MPVCYTAKTWTNHSHCPPTLIKFQETGGTVTHNYRSYTLYSGTSLRRVGEHMLKTALRPTIPTPTSYLKLLKKDSRALMAHL